MSTDVDFYSYMNAMVFGDTSESVDEVNSPRFLFLSFLLRLGLRPYYSFKYQKT